jgi:hypothetical protein
MRAVRDAMRIGGLQIAQNDPAQAGRSRHLPCKIPTDAVSVDDEACPSAVAWATL